MTLEDLRAFVAAYREGSMSGAARRLGCTQGAIAQHVRKLEKELGSELFVRQRRGIVPTAHGAALFETADTVLDRLDRAVEGIRMSARNESRRLRITTSTGIVSRYLRAPLLALRERHQDVEIQVESEHTTEQRIAALRDGRADLALIPLTDPLQSIEVRDFGSAHLVLLVHRDHPFANKTSLQLSDLSSVRYIAQSATSGTYRHVQRAFRELGVELTPSEIVPDSETALLLVEAGRGETFAPLSIAAALERDHAVKAVAVPAVPPLPMVWAARSFAMLPSIAEEFIAVCTEQRMSKNGARG